MAVIPAEEPVPDCEDDLPLADELNTRAEALIARIDKHLARRGPPEYPEEIPRITATDSGQEAVAE